MTGKWESRALTFLSPIFCRWFKTRQRKMTERWLTGKWESRAFIFLSPVFLSVSLCLGGSKLPMNRRIQHRVLEDTELGSSLDLLSSQSEVEAPWTGTGKKIGGRKMEVSYEG